MKMVLAGCIFFGITVLAIENNDGKNSVDQYSTLSEIIDFKKFLIPTTEVDDDQKEQVKLLRIMFSNDFPSIMFASMPEKKFLPIFYGYHYIEGYLASNKFDFCSAGWNDISLSNAQGKKIKISRDNWCQIGFNQQANKLFARKDQEHFIIAEKINGDFCAVKPPKQIFKDLTRKPGLYMRGKKIFFLDEATQQSLEQHDFYLGFIKEDELIFTQEDAQRNYICEGHGLLSSNKKFLAAKENNFVEVSEIKIANNTLSLICLYKLETLFKISYLGLSDDGNLLCYDGQNKYKTGGSNFLNNEHFFLMMLMHLLRPAKSHPILAKLAHTIVDSRLLNDEIFVKWQNRKTLLKVMVLNILDDLNRDVRYIVMEMVFTDEDYDFRNRMLSYCTNRKKGQTLLQELSIKFHGSRNTLYTNKTINLVVDEKTTNLLEELFPEHLAVIGDKYRLLYTDSFSTNSDAQ